MTEQADNPFHTPQSDPLDDIQIGVVSKKRFLEWWKRHTTTYPIRNEKGIVDSGKIVQLTPQGFNVNGNFVVTDVLVLRGGGDKTHEIPFKLNHIDQFVIDLSELHSLKNCPKSCKMGQFGSNGNPMAYLDSLIGCPERAQSLSVFTKMPMLNLESSLQGHIASLSIQAPSFVSFDGLTVECDHLSLYGCQQQSFKGIHRSLRSNVKSLGITVHQDFSGGVLPFAMLEPGIQVTTDISGNPPFDFVDAMGVVIDGRKEGLNAHDIQELLIDKGLGKYARL